MLLRLNEIAALKRVVSVGGATDGATARHNGSAMM